MSELSYEELQARNEQLEADLATARWRERQQQISQPRTLVRTIPMGAEAGPVKMPTTGEMLQLRDIVLQAHPRFGPGDIGISDREWMTQFCGSFEALSAIPRQDFLETRYYMSFWIDHAEEILRRINMSMRLSNSPFICAALCWNDIPHDVGISQNPGQSINLGLAIGQGRQPNSDAWRELLVTRRLLPPIRNRTQSPYSNEAQPWPTGRGFVNPG